MNYAAEGTSRLPLDNLTATIARIRALLLTEERVDRAVHLLARGIKESMPGAAGTGVSLMDAGGRRTSSGFTDLRVKQVDTRRVEQVGAAQDELGEGPCITAWATGQIVIVSDVDTDKRWPFRSSAVAALSAPSVVSTPLIARNEATGALEIYSSLQGQYDEQAGRTLSLFVGTAAKLLAHFQGSGAPLRMTEQLKTALANRDTINRACGLLMERQDISQDNAMQQLIENIRMAGVPLAETSETLITRVPLAER